VAGAGATLAALLSTYLGVCILLLSLYTHWMPPTTGVRIQRQVEAFIADTPYTPQSTPVPASAIADHLEHAVVAAEDARFYTHHGIDWIAIREAVEDNLERGTAWRGGSSITQQLVKNLFMTTHSTLLRKGLELPLAYAADFILPKARILELYLNVVEWGPGVFGAEAAARYHYGLSADALSRYQSAALAACLPNPRSRTPAQMTSYTYRILGRMRQHGW
jgi:monofunctional biosynthetic peptidoglycan transglycosylase